MISAATYVLQTRPSGKGGAKLQKSLNFGLPWQSYRVEREAEDLSKRYHEILPPVDLSRAGKKNFLESLVDMMMGFIIRREK